jgi:hypothetical protein
LPGQFKARTRQVRTIEERFNITASHVTRENGARCAVGLVDEKGFNQPEVMIANAPQKFDPAGNLTDETALDLIRQLLRNLVDWTEQLRKHSDRG